MLKTSLAIAIPVLAFLIAVSSMRGSRGQTSLQTVPKQQEKAATLNDDLRLFVRIKLSCSQKMLSGLVTEDYAQIRSAAQEMKRVHQAKTWPQTKDEMYNHYNRVFAVNRDKLEKMAASKNLEGVRFAYLQLTASCVDCHSYFRGRFKVQQPAPKKGPVQLIPTYWDDKK